MSVEECRTYEVSTCLDLEAGKLKTQLLLYFFVTVFGISPVLLAENNLYWQAIKINSHDSVDPQYGISIRVLVPETKACSVKGPLMEAYASAEWFPWMDAWNILIYPTSLSGLQQQGLGQWELKLVFDDGRESLHTFDISGVLEGRDFLPLPEIVSPAHHASAVIGQDYTMQWDPNDAHLNAHLLLLEITGENYSYFESLVYFNDDISITQWHPGWLGIGDAYAKVGYVLVRNSRMQVTHISGPVINWDNTAEFIVSGARNDFTVKFSIDLNEDGIIDLSDMAVLFSHWLEMKQPYSQ